MTKLICKILYAPAQTRTAIEIIGEVDKERLISDKYDLMTVEHKKYLNNQLISHKSFISKKDIIKILVFKESMRFVLNKENLAWNSHIEPFVGAKT
jgi:hypothetical protein